MQHKTALWKYWQNQILTPAEERYITSHIKQHKHIEPFRFPQTHNERAQTACHLADPDIQMYGVHIRQARSPAALPTAYDDIPHSTYASVEHYA
jgi:hypothetical protein